MNIFNKFPVELGDKQELGKKANILIVDDDKSTCKTLSFIFNKHGYETEIARTGHNAIAKVKKRFYNVTLLDIKLPDIKGSKLLPLLKEIHPDMEVLIITGYATMENAIRALNEGASAFITKPLNIEEVLAKIKNIFEKQRLIFEKRRIEQKLIESEKIKRAMLDAYPESMLMLDNKARVLEINKKAAQRINKRVEDIIGKSIHDFFPPEIAKPREILFNEVLRTGKPIQNIDEQFGRFYDAIIYPIFDDQKKVEKVAIFSRDVTEQKKAEQKLLESEEKFRSLYESSIDGIVRTNLEGKILECNQAYLDMLGYTMEEIKERVYQQITPKKWHEMEEGIVKNQFIARGYSDEYEKEYIRKEGTIFPVALKGWVIRDENENPKEMLGYVRDITLRKQSEKKISDLAKFPSENPNPVLRGDKERIIYSNKAGVDIFNISEGDEIPENLQDTLKEVFSTNKNKKVELRLNEKIYSFVVTPVERKRYVNIYGLEITEIKKAEQKLKESEKLYKYLANELEMILDHIPGIIVYKDTENNILRVNQFLADAHNLPKEEMEGKSCFDLYPKDQAQAYWEDDLEVIQSGKPKLNIVEPWEPEKGKRWVNTSKIPYIDENGNVKGIIAIASDMTEMKLAQEKLKESEEKLRMFMESATDGFILFDPELNYIDANKVALQILGMNKEDLIGKNIFDIVPNLKETGRYNKYLEVIKTGKPFSTEDVIFNSLDGSMRYYLSVRAFKVGENLGIIFTDIAERKRMEQKLKESEEKYKNERDNLINILNSIEDGVCIVNAKHDIEYANPQLIKEIGPYEGKKCFAYFYDRNDMCSWCYIKEVFAGETIRREWMSPKNLKTYDLINTPLKNPDGSISKLEIFHDITQRKKIEQKLKDISRLKSELLRRASHELKTPLVSIKGYVDLLLNIDYEKFDSDTIFSLDQIREGCLRLETLVNDILKSSKLEYGKIQLKPSWENLAFLIKFCVNELKGLANSRNQDISLELHDRLNTMFEKEKIYEVISNLLTNAIKYTPPNGKIKIKSNIKENFYIISVEDNGIGFTEQEMEQLFTQFGKIERYGHGWDLGIEGSGLGLYISKKFVDLHDGKIWVESKGRNKGSTFYFSLPITNN